MLVQQNRQGWFRGDQDRREPEHNQQVDRPAAPNSLISQSARSGTPAPSEVVGEGGGPTYTLGPARSVGQAQPRSASLKPRILIRDGSLTALAMIQATAERATVNPAYAGRFTVPPFLNPGATSRIRRGAESARKGEYPCCEKS